MLRILIYISTFCATVLLACGVKNRSETSSVSSAIPRDVAPPQGFLISEMEITPAGEMCNTQFGSLKRFVPLDKSKNEESLLTCFDYERVVENDPSQTYAQEPFESNAGDHLNFGAKTLGDFCEQNQIEDLGAMLFSHKSDDDFLNAALEGYPCIDSGEEVSRILIKNDEGQGVSFDMRTLRYFPNMRELIISSNKLTGYEVFEAPKGLKTLVVQLLGGMNQSERSVLHSSIAKNLPQVEYLEIHNHFNHKAKEVVDASFLAYLPNLRVLLSFSELENVSVLAGHESLEIIEIPKSSDQIDTRTIKNLRSIRYEVDQGSNFNASDQKIFTIREQVFIR